MAISSNPRLPLTGRNVVVTVFIGGLPAQQTDLANSFTITEQVVQYRDKYLGRDRDRTDEQTTGYDCRLDVQYAGSQLVSAILAQKAARQFLQPIPVISLGFTMQNRDGTADAYVLQNCTTKMEIDFKGKDERGMINLQIQAEDLVQRTL